MEDINVTLISLDPKLIANHIETFFPNFNLKKKECTSEAYPFQNYLDIYEIHVHTYLNSDEQSNIITLLKNLLSHDIVSGSAKRYMIIKCLGKLPHKVGLFLKECTELFFNTTLFVFACRSTCHLPRYILNTCLVIRIPALGKADSLFKKTAVDTLIEHFLNGKIKLRDLCLRLSASGISFAEISKSIINIFSDSEHHNIHKIVGIVAEMEYKSHVVNKDLFVLENYLNILYDQWHNNILAISILNMEL